MIANLSLRGDRDTTLQAALQSWLGDIGQPDIRVHACPIYPNKPLRPAEYELVGHSVARRKAEFAAGRHCARRLLEGYGEFHEVVAIGSRGEPLWPEGIIGSISHDRHCAVAIANRNRAYRGIGIDLVDDGEQIGEVDPDLIANEVELHQFAEHLGQDGGEPAGTGAIDPLLLVFSLKEAAIKAVSPSIDFYLDFRAIELQPLAEANAASACFRDLGLSTRGHWTVIGGMLFSVMWLARADGPLPGTAARS